MLKIAKKSYNNLNLVQADAEYLPFRANTFEIINIFTVIQNLLSLEKLFKEIDWISRDFCDFYISILKKDKLLSEFEEFVNKSPYNLIEKIIMNEIEDILFYIKKRE